jgi:hypothetical protein
MKPKLHKDLSERLNDRLKTAAKDVKANWPQWMLTDSGLDRALNGQATEVRGEAVQQESSGL